MMGADKDVIDPTGGEEIPLVDFGEGAEGGDDYDWDETDLDLLPDAPITEPLDYDIDTLTDRLEELKKEVRVSSKTGKQKETYHKKLFLRGLFDREIVKKAGPYSEKLLNEMKLENDGGKPIGLSFGGEDVIVVDGTTGRFRYSQDAAPENCNRL